VGVEGDVVVVDVEGDGGGSAEEEADGEVGEGADEAGGLGGGFVGERRVHDLLAVDPEGFPVGLVVELPLEEEPAAKGDGGAGVPVFGAVDLVGEGGLEICVGGGDLEEAGVGETGGAGGEEDGVAIGRDGGDVDVGSAEVVVAALSPLAHRDV
jgi:hypothetical protein